MGIAELLIFAVVLSMDAFAVALCKGLSAKRVTFFTMLWVGAWFGGFQALMPLSSYLLAAVAQSAITAYDHWISFGLLAFLGGKMIAEALFGKEEGVSDSFSAREMLLLALSTSVDALAAGITLALLPDVNIALGVLLIGCITFLLSFAGVKLGNLFGAKYGRPATLCGGIVLLALGIKILWEHLGGAV